MTNTSNLRYMAGDVLSDTPCTSRFRTPDWVEIRSQNVDEVDGSVTISWQAKIGRVLVQHCCN